MDLPPQWEQRAAGGLLVEERRSIAHRSASRRETVASAKDETLGPVLLGFQDRDRNDSVADSCTG